MKAVAQSNLNAVELKAFVPAKSYEESKQFYQELGFSLASDTEGVAYFHCGGCSFLLQDFYHPELACNLMMHLLVEDLDAWYDKVIEAKLAERYRVKLSSPQHQPWGMRDFVIADPSGVLWRIAEKQ